MAAGIDRRCSVTNCPTRITEVEMTNAGLHYLNTLWVAAVRAGTTTKCLAHYLDTDIPTTYSAYIKGDSHRGNRELR